MSLNEWSVGQANLVSTIRPEVVVRFEWTPYTSCANASITRMVIARGLGYLGGKSAVVHILLCTLLMGIVAVCEWLKKYQWPEKLKNHGGRAKERVSVVTLFVCVVAASSGLFVLFLNCLAVQHHSLLVS